MFHVRFEQFSRQFRVFLVWISVSSEIGEEYSINWINWMVTSFNRDILPYSSNILKRHFKNSIYFSRSQTSSSWTKFCKFAACFEDILGFLKYRLQEIR